MKVLLITDFFYINNFSKILNFFLQVEAQGYQVLAKEEKQLTKEDAAEFYKQHEGSVSLLLLTISLYYLL